LALVQHMKKTVLKIFMLVSVLTACSGGIAPSTANETATLAPVPTEYAGLTNPVGGEAAAQGAELYRVNCETCHGPQGHGDGPAGQSLTPKPGNLAQVQAQAGDDYLFWRIHDGKPGTAMVAWRGILTDEQIWQIVSFLRTLE
jgi:mono/diheme cytochrome c family protein